MVKFESSGGRLAKSCKDAARAVNKPKTLTEEEKLRRRIEQLEAENTCLKNCGT